MNERWLVHLVYALLARAGSGHSLRPSKSRCRALRAALLVGLAIGLVVCLSFALGGAGVATATGQDNGTVAANNTTTIDGNVEFAVRAPENQVVAGEENTLTLFVEQRGSVDGEHPAELTDRATKASSVQIAIVGTDSENLELDTDFQSLGNLSRGDVVEATFNVTIPPGTATGESQLRVRLVYDGVTQLNYTESGEIVEETRTQGSADLTVPIQVTESEGPGPLFYLLWLLPGLIPAFIAGVWLFGKRNTRIEGILNRVARVLFGSLVSSDEERERRIESAYIGMTYRTYAAKSLLFAVLGFVAGLIAGAYIIAGIMLIFEALIQALAGLPRTITRPLGIHPDYVFEISSRTRWLVLLVGGLLIGLITSALAYVFRWQVPASDAAVRRRGINGGLARMTAFMYALSRGGMEFPQILRILTDNREVYGETANEMSIAVREMDLFGRDMITALRRMSRRTPSEQFKTFSENLTSVLQSGSDLSTFFSDQYERFREEAEERQEEILELLSTIAEAYVTILVAGMLFFITILLVFGLTVADTLWLLQLIIYLMIPLANAGFAVFLQQQLEALGIGGQSGAGVLDRMNAATPVEARPQTEEGQADGGFSHANEAENRKMMALTDRVNRVKDAFRNPLGVVLRAPEKILWVTVPIALIAFAVRAPAAFQAEGVTLRILDGLLIQSALFVLATYAVLRYFYKRRIDRIEAATPELLEQLASLNEAGMSVVQGLDRVRGSDLGVLTPEVERIWRDIKYGANVADALVRFGRRVRTSAVVRIVTLLTNAMRASGNMGPVLRIASEQARAEIKLRNRRRREMLTYLVVIYIAFFVFLVIILAVNEVLVPSLPETVPTPEGRQAQRLGASPDSIARFGEVDQAAYTLIFFHAALIQAVSAGFIGGQLGEGSLKDGAKHATVMLGIAYLAFVVISSPIASIGLETQQVRTQDGPLSYEVRSTGDSITQVERVSLSKGGFIAVYGVEDGVNGTLLGHTEYLPPGEHTDLSIPMMTTIEEYTTVRFVVHRDTNNNEEFDFEQPYQPGGGQADRPYSSPAQGGTPGLEVRVLPVGG